MRDDQSQPDDEGSRGYAALRWVLVLVLTALIVRGGVAMLGRNHVHFRDVKRLTVVALGAVGGLAYLICTLVLGTKRVETILEVSWAVVAALALVVVLTIL